MLAEWYFCCCISANPSDTEAFLSILESLENPESDSQLLYLSCNELKHAEDRMQIYALPVVLKSLRRENFPAGLTNTIKHYFNHLTENVPEGVRNSIRQLVNLVSSNQPSVKKIIETVNTFILERRRLQERRCAPVPYLDLKDFLPETLVLAVLADQLENHERLIDELIVEVNEQDETPSLINGFLQSALEHQFGRMAFRLSASIVSLTSIEYPDKLKSLIAKQASAVAHAEPDLLCTYAITLFGDRNAKDTATSLCQQIILESLTLSELRNLIREVHNQDGQALDAAFRRVGIQRTPNRTEGLPTIYWQIALWELAARIDALATAEGLVHPWTPGRLREQLHISCPEIDIPGWIKTQFTSLLNLRGLPRRISLQVKHGTKFRLDNQDKDTWLFLSPWIARTQNPNNLYPTSDEPAQLVRIMGSVLIAIRLLQKLAQDNCTKVEFAARLLAHASDVTAIVERRYNKGEAPQLSPALMGLFRFTQRQIRLAGTGQFEAIDPRIFVEICERGKALREESSNIQAEEALFFNPVLPEVLISWVEAGYPSAVSTKLSGRWLSLIRDIYPHISEHPHSFPERQKAALVTRFLCPDYSPRPEEDDRLNWKIERSRSTSRWEIRYRKLLLTKRLHPNEWIGSEWDDENVDWGSDPSKIVSNRLVYTLELLDAIGRYLPDAEINSTLLEQTFSNWKHCLNSVGKAENLDRFTRLRLLEFLDSCILENRPEEQILLSSVLLEYGSIYDLKKMFEQVYVIEADNRTFKEMSSTRQELQIALLPMIFDYLQKNTELIQEIYHRRDTWNRQRKPQSPREAYKQLQYAKLFKEWVNKLLYLSFLRNNDVDYGNNLTNLRHALLEEKSNTKNRTKILNVELRNDQKLLVLPPEEEPIPDWSIKAINYDPNRLTATVFYEDFDISGVENLFERSRDDIRTLSHEADPPLNVLAVIVDVTEDEQDGQWRYTFDCGFEFTLSYSSNQSFKPGDYIRLPIRQYKQGNKSWWGVSYRYPIKSLTHSSQPGDISKISVSETWKDGLYTLFLQRHLSNHHTEKITDTVNLRLWNADISRSFCQRSRSLKRNVFTKLNAQQKWEPIDLHFSDLLSQMLHSQQRSNTAVLTLIEATIGQFGEKAWRFSRQPGENYLIEQNYFLGKDGATLADAIASYQNRRDGAVGLLISVALDLDSQADQVGLRLITDTINSVASDEFYPDLTVPLDDRNIKWRELFDRSNKQLLATRDNHRNWIYQLQENMVIPGYPRQIGLTWKRTPDQNQPTAELLIIQWKDAEWRRAVALGETPPFYKITPHNQDWQAFLDRWLSLPEKQYIESAFRVHLKGKESWGSIDPEMDGFVSCLTSENLRIWVQAESLTMLPLVHQEKSPLGSNREAEIFWIEWSKIQTRPTIKSISIPPHAVRNDRCIGIITGVPKSTIEGTQCQVVWQVSQGEIQEQGLQIDNLAEIRINQGYKIVGQYRQGIWTFHLENPKIRARALWSLKPWKSDELGELFYLGTVSSSDGRDLEIAESKLYPGKLICLPHRPQEPSHLAIGKEIKSKDLRFKENLLWADNRTSNTARLRYTFDKLSSQYQRVILKLNEQLLIGDCKKLASSAVNEEVTIQSIELVLTQRDDQKCVLQRRFDLRQIPNIKKKQNAKIDTDRWKRRLEDYLQKPPKPLRATFAKNKGNPGFLLSKHESDEIQVPEDSSWQNWTLWVPLALEQDKFVIGGSYSDQARICLFREQWQILASCRLVPPLTLEEFRIGYCEAPSLNIDVFLLKDKDIHLYYVGSEEASPAGERYTEIYHRFEMGYGETLLIPESRLEFDDDSFSKAQFSLFYGDLIKVISFKTILLEDSEVDQGVQFILNIKGLYLQWSEARQLYHQSSRYQIVHLLHLNPESKDLEISYIDGFNENVISQQRKFEPKKFKAYLTPESKARLSNRLQRWADNAESDPVIFGRLDEDRFRSSYGKDIYFEHVRLSFVESSKGPCLLNKDLVFLRADKIIELRSNDMALTLKPPKGFDAEDVGKDAKSLLLLRRNFSVREKLLKQVYQEKGETHFQDDRLLIQLRTQQDDPKITSLLLIEGDRVPSRKASALLGAVSNLGKAGLLATIVRAEDRGVVQIEYKPGIFVRLQPYQIQSRPHELTRGTLVRIEASDGKLSITRAAFGNAQYVSESIRPSVILPTNEIQRIDPEDWASQGRFVIGGLPDIVARPGSYANEQWKKALEIEVITDLMARQHPKIVCLGKDKSGNYRIAPLRDSFPCGRLTRMENSLAVQYVPLNSESTDPVNREISWHLLSFADESIQQILNRANAHSWRYHDNETFTWVPDTKKIRVEKLQKRDHTVWTGPIFFQSLAGELRLRYTQSEFRRFGFPVEELIDALKQRERSHCYPIAGISKSVEGGSQSPEYSLWIELVPGHLVELPTQLIVWQSGINDKYQPLTNLMHWQGLAPGDQLELELVSTDPLTIDRIALKNWLPGARKAFGLNRCFLPIETIDKDQGEITLGRGEFKLKLPFNDCNSNWQIVILTPENSIQGITASETTESQPECNPNRNDVVLMGVNDQNKIVVLGFETMTPVLDKGEANTWKNHPVTGCLIREWHEKPSIDSERLKNWIQAAGGALPVTVEGRHKTENQHLLFFSMRYQQDAALIPPGCISLARFVDLLSDQRTALLRCGGGLITLPMRQIVSGLDRSFYTVAAEQLKQAQVSLWLRREQNGEIKVEFSDDSENQDLLVESLDILLQKDEGEVGLICQSIEAKTLHWFPIQEAAWTALSVAEFRDVFQLKGAFKVRRKLITRENQVGKTSIISMLAVPDVYVESQKLTIGQELDVQVVKQVETNDENKQRYLVESLTSQMILDCEIYDRQHLQTGDIIPVEVVQHIKGSPELITVVPVGKKRKHLDLPNWMTEQLPEPGRRRLSISKYLRWRQSEQVISIDDPDNSLDRLLCHFFNDAYGAIYGQTAQNSAPVGQLEVAKLWEKQNRYKSEINAAFAIMAILLLNKHEETEREAYKLTQNLGRRALRSLHIEVLYQRWLSIESNRKRKDGLWQRLRQLENEQHLYVPLKENSPAAIRQFCNAVEMQSHTELLPIANSLSAALGELSSTSKLDTHALVTKQLIDLFYALTPKSALQKLKNYHTNKLQEILKSIDENGFDIILLEPLNYKADYYSKKLVEVDLLSEFFPKDQVEFDWKSWILQQIDHLEGLTDQCISLQENTKSLKDRFQRIHQILGEK